MNRILFYFILLQVFTSNNLQAEHLSSHLQFTARMSGNQEVPIVVSDAQGVGVFTLDDKKSTLYINVSLSNLSGPITGMHIHEAVAGENGPVVFNLGSYLVGNRAKGILKGITPEVITKLLNGRYYINVHTDLNPGGEIRGQIGLETDYRYTAFMLGINEVPEVTTDGRGMGIFHLNHSKTKVDFKVIFNGLSSDVTGAHIHNAASGANGPVIFDLDPFINGNTIEGSWDPGAHLDALQAGELYINVHTTNNPGGEIRSQISLLPGITFDASLSGEQENPMVITSGQGLAVITIWPELNEFEFYIQFDSMSGPVTGAHFHSAIPGMNGPVVIDLTEDISSDGNYISGTRILTPEIFNSLLNGELYLNLHTTNNPGGEIRGQVYKFAREGYTYELNGGQEVPPVTTTGVGAGMVSIDRDQTNAHYMLVVSDLNGNFSASHFHNGSPGVNGGVIYDITSSFNEFGGAYGYWDDSSTPTFDAGPLFRAHDVYVNVHTDTSPGGEIRGNIIRSSNLFDELPFDPGFSDDLMLKAILTGGNEVPPVTTDAVALASVFLEADKNSAKINITATGLSGPITGVHIHEADPGNNGPVIIPLNNVGNRVQMEINNIDPLSLVSLLNSGTYVNIHTDANPAGEIRGQLNLEQDITFVAFLTGAEEVPEVITDGIGLAVIHYTIGQLTIDIDAQLTGLSSDITGVHLHAGMPGENGPVIVDLGDLRDGNRLSGSLETSVDNLNELFSGNVYINVHTSNNPGGEIRGQMTIIPGITFDGWMSPMQEVPFVTSEASGLAVSTLYPGPGDLVLWMVTDGVSGPVSAAHLHQAPQQQNGGVVHDLTDDIAGNSIVHFGTINDEILSAFLTGEIYINAHTPAFPAGELRGQMYRRARDGYGFDLCKEQEPGTIEAPNATGSALVSIGRDHQSISIHVVTDGLTGDLAASHIHEAPIGSNGGVITDLTAFFTDGAMFVDGATTDTSLINRIRSGNTYINVHTDLHPGGEIRGQIVKEFLCDLTVAVDPLADIVSEVSLSPIPVFDELNVSIATHHTASLSFRIVDISGKSLSADTYDLTQGENMISLNTSSLLPGFYLLMITDGKATQAYKFVK
jgi:Cu/Zn superoxide dismutase